MADLLPDPPLPLPECAEEEEEVQEEKDECVLPPRASSRRLTNDTYLDNISDTLSVQIEQFMEQPLPPLAPASPPPSSSGHGTD